MVKLYIFLKTHEYEVTEDDTTEMPILFLSTFNEKVPSLVLLVVLVTIFKKLIQFLYLGVTCLKGKKFSWR